MKNVLMTAFLAVFLVVFAGCGQPEQMVSSDPVCLPGVQTDQVMEAAQVVLTRMQFSIEKYDLEARYLRTRPLSGAQFFQLFRGDNASSHTAAEANLYSLRRIVELDVTPFADQVCIQCRVFVQQLSIPEKPLEGTMSIAGSFTHSSYREQSLALDGEQLEKMEWLDRGLDRALEQKIVQTIKETMEKEQTR